MPDLNTTDYVSLSSNRAGQATLVLIGTTPCPHYPHIPWCAVADSVLPVKYEATDNQKWRCPKPLLPVYFGASSSVTRKRALPAHGASGHEVEQRGVLTDKVALAASNDPMDDA